jgi:hypothetical protein
MSDVFSGGSRISDSHIEAILRTKSFPPNVTFTYAGTTERRHHTEHIVYMTHEIK